MENEKENRLKELESLRNYVEITNKKIDNMIVSAGWTIPTTKNSKRMFECPFNSSHQFSEQKLEEHLESCQWKAEGYHEWDVPLSEPISSDAHTSIKFDEQTLKIVLQQAKAATPTMQIGTGDRLLPRTSNRIFSDFTSDERRAVYEYVIAKTIKPDVGEDISNLNKLEENNKSSYLELLAHERDLKRRRAKHRGVHTNKKSHIEILREVINQQMEMLKEYLNVKTNSNNQRENELDKNVGTYYIANSTAKEINIDKDETTKKDHVDKKNSEKNMHNHNRFHPYYNDSERNHDYHREKKYLYDDKDKKLSKNYESSHKHSSKHSYELSKRHHKNEEHIHSSKRQKFDEKSSKYSSKNTKYDDDYRNKYNNKSVKYDKIHHHDKSYKHEILKYSNKSERRYETSTRRRN